MLSPVATLLLSLAHTAPPAEPPPIRPVPPPMHQVPPAVPGTGVIMIPPGAPPFAMPAPAGFPARPMAALPGLIRPDDYPAAAIRAGEEGTVGYRLEIAPNGRVTACTIARSSGSAALDSTTCRILRARARFTPARDAQGRPVAGRFDGRFTWRINRPLDMPFAPFLVVEEMRADAAGHVTCTSAINAAPPTEKPCPADNSAAGLAALARRQGKALALANVTRLTPEGQDVDERADGAGRGDLYRASDAMLTIAADGSIAECRILRREFLGGGNSGLPTSLCAEWYLGRSLYQQVADDAPARRVRASDRGYAAH